MTATYVDAKTIDLMRRETNRGLMVRFHQRPAAPRCRLTTSRAGTLARVRSDTRAPGVPAPARGLIDSPLTIFRRCREPGARCDLTRAGVRK
jgi:hypothetical protein